MIPTDRSTGAATFRALSSIALVLVLALFVWRGCADPAAQEAASGDVDVDVTDAPAPEARRRAPPANREPGPSSPGPAPREVDPTRPAELEQAVPRGRLELAFAAPDGRPVEDVVVAVQRRGSLEERAAQRVAPASSNAAGEVAFELVGGDWTWSVTSGHDVDPVPPPEPEHVAVAGGWRSATSGAPGAPSASGVVAIVAGETRRFDVLVHRGAHVIGALPTTRFPGDRRGDRSWHSVELLRVEHARHPEGPHRDLVTLRQTRSVKIDESGAFRIEHVAPGSYSLQAWWRLGDDVHAATVAFELSRDETEDLGVLASAAGTPLVIACELELDGAPAHADAVWRGEGAPWLRLALTGPVLQGQSPFADRALVDVEIGSVLRIHGLAPGSWEIGVLGVGRGVQLDVMPVERVIVTRPDPPSFDLPRFEPLHLPVSAVRQRDLHVVCPCEPEARVRLDLLDLRARTRTAASASVAADGLARSVHAVPPGSYAVHAQLHGADGSLRGAWGTIEVGRDLPAVELELVPTPARRISGLLIDDRGRPLSGRPVTFAPRIATWAAVASTTTGGDGSFDLELVDHPDVEPQGCEATGAIDPVTGRTLWRRRR